MSSTLSGIKAELRAPWKLRIVAAAAGGLASLLVGVVTLLTWVGAIIGLVGAPVGAILGFVLGPRAVSSGRPLSVVLLGGIVAVPLGVVGYAVWAALSESRGASVGDLLTDVGYWSTSVWPIGLFFGGPMALGAAAVATWWLRRTPNLEGRWAPAATFVVLVALATGMAFASAARAGGDEAQRIADQVPFEYVARQDGDFAPTNYLLDVRSYWRGTLSDGSMASGFAPCEHGRDSLQGSDWAIWVTSDQAWPWEENPSTAPLVSSDTYGRGIPVRLTITVNLDGSATWQRGIIGGC